MAWQPNVAAQTDTTAIYKGLEGVWPGLKAVEIVRMSNGRDGATSLGKHTRDPEDTPSSITDDIARLCNDDTAALGGDRQQYEIRAFVLKRTRQGNVEEAKTLGRLRFGQSEGGDKPTGGLIREAAALVKSIGDASGAAADAEGKRMENVARSVELLVDMNVAMRTSMESQTQVNANAVRMFELKLADDKEQREANREAAEKAADRAYEQQRDEQMMVMLAKVGTAVGPGVLDVLGALAVKIRVDAAAKAKHEGVDMPPPPPDPPPSSGATVTQDNKLRDEVVAVLDSLTAAEKKKIAKAIEEDAWSVLVAASQAPDDRQAAIILDRLARAIFALGPDKINKARVVISELSAEKQAAIEAVFKTAGIGFT